MRTIEELEAELKRLGALELECKRKARFWLAMAIICALMFMLSISGFAVEAVRLLSN